MTRPQVASRSEVARGLRASVCAAKPRRGPLLYKAWNFCCNKCAVAVAAVAFAWGEATADGVVSFKDAATIKSWDAWNEHKPSAQPKERRSVNAAGSQRRRV